MTFAATILTLYPEMFPGPLGISLAGRALERGDWACETVQIRDFATDRHRTVDDTPAGGGAGMVLKPDVLAAALDSVLAKPSPLQGRGLGEGAGRTATVAREGGGPPPPPPPPRGGGG
ncbi:tRNA (guanosine(37)-N1)-methyltransferase TrmD, partial [Altererythrobacter sp. C41]|nr:tRNA (guanosine(37)-N1)-methyltransferase TrmD [Altererythrobacter sp. C41]